MKKSELDKFYTKPEIAEFCISKIPVLEQYSLFIEPAAGAGTFLKRLPMPRIGIDILPDDDEIIELDFFEFKPTKVNNIIVVGNPPFGKNASLAIRFFNHAAQWADTIAFIVPKTFRKTSIQNNLSLSMVLHLDVDLPDNSFILFNDDNSISEYSVSSCFQIWCKGSRAKIKLPTTHSDWRWVPKSKAKYAIRRVGGLAGKCFTEFSEYSESSNYFIDCDEQVFNTLNSLFKEFQSVAKNTVANPSLSKTEIVDIYNSLS